ncbi:hypothetical protein SARC_06914 [Sphaeroforma arctica JP610]|uniref:Uncharacterized protein n=1 Tax=Sphaeroforma arctica JP610 TaxID=667725 RepID=A0A0L0FV55_9EUKA|nr:hypothetical protein SARC_06914 [Sphaeroforma arctica JP610]KNC80730.1 hypothetical protein SARC_06914 [Sphaeroforma arctica JP610]|eukprot:XP_014154632.1 hypothetical protein SARC_06914 [Sphaeroforma arctica JP610]
MESLVLVVYRFFYRFAVLPLTRLAFSGVILILSFSSNPSGSNLGLGKCCDIRRKSAGSRPVLLPRIGDHSVKGSEKSTQERIVRTEIETLTTLSRSDIVAIVFYDSFFDSIKFMFSLIEFTFLDRLVVNVVEDVFFVRV